MHIYDTQETLPESLLKALLDARFFQSGMQSLRQIEFALLILAFIKQPCFKSQINPSHAEMISVKYAVLETTPITDSNIASAIFSQAAMQQVIILINGRSFWPVMPSIVSKMKGIFNTTTGKISSVYSSSWRKDTALDAFINFRGREPK